MIQPGLLGGLALIEMDLVRWSAYISRLATE